MEFGVWVGQLRQAQRHSLQTMSRRTGINAGTIQRIERLGTHARLTTAFRICEGYGVTLAQLRESLSEGASKQPLAVLKLAHPAQAMDTASLDHAEQLIETFQSERKEQICQWLVASLNAIVSEAHTRTRIQAVPMSPITELDIHRWLFPSPLYTFEWNYPSLAPSTILWTYEQGGALTPFDATAYACARLKGHRGYEKLAEGSFERLKLDDLCRFDASAGEQGRILALYWEACFFLARFDPLQLLEDGRTISASSKERDPQYAHDVRRFRLALLYILIYRWNQGLFGKEACPPRWP